MRGTRGVWIRGMAAGVAGATVLALWFLLVDLAASSPFRTPAMIGAALFGMEGLEGSPGLIALFTVFHFSSFLVVGGVTAWGMSHLESAPNVPLGMVVGLALFLGIFYGSAAVTGLDVVSQLGWVEVLVGNVLAGVTLVAVLHQTGITGRVAWWSALQEGAVVREGLIAGVASGFLVATWFLVVDLVQGRPFFTPSALGSVLFLGASDLAEVQVSLWIALAYTPVHYAVIIPFGIAAAALLREAEAQPQILLGGVLFFVAFEAFFLGVIAVAAEFLMGPLAWWSIAVGNLVGVITMVGYLWKKHPELARSLGTETLERPA
jgi:hypothetical protein